MGTTIKPEETPAAIIIARAGATEETTAKERVDVADATAEPQTMHRLHARTRPTTVIHTGRVIMIPTPATVVLLAIAPMQP